MIAHVEVRVFRAPTPAPVATSFGVMANRPAVFVRIEDAGGAFGWGEIFANWPAAGAEHRARLLAEDMADLVFAAPSEDAGVLSDWLTARTRIRAIQCGEPGPFAHVIAGLGTALSDLRARRAGVPLARHLGAEATSVPIYASGIAAAGAAERIDAARAGGTRAFKVKVGFDHCADLAVLTELAGDLRDGERLFADANQAWDVGQARAFMEAAPALGWMEEPIAADAPAADWEALAGYPTPLAGGENLTSFDAPWLSVIQPDVAKWGGVAGCLAVARAALASGRTYCPHFLGGGIGLTASAHLLAAAGGPGLLEVDVNPNPLRDAFGAAREGRWEIADAPGLGITDLPEEIARFETYRAEIVRP